MLLNALLLALREIRRNLMRSFLTVLGIVIGVAAVITMVTLGNGATQMVADQIASLGSNLLMVMPGQRLGPGRDSAGAPKFKIADVEAIQQQINGLRRGGAGSRQFGDAGGQHRELVIHGQRHDQRLLRSPATGSWPPGACSATTRNAPARPCASSATPSNASCSATKARSATSIRVKTFACEVIGLLAAKGQGSMGRIRTTWC